MKILYLTTLLPRHRQNGGEIVSQYFIDAFEHYGHEVTILGYQRINSGYVTRSNEIRVDKRYIETEQSGYYPLLWMCASFIKNLPYSVAKFYSKNYINKVKTLLSHNNYDAIVIDHAQMAWLEPLISEKDKIFFCAHNVENKIYLENTKNTKNPVSQRAYNREANLIKQLENKLATIVKEVWTITPDDYNYFSEVKSKNAVKLFSIPSPLATSNNNQIANNKFDIGLIGSWTWKANLAGLEWFFQSVYPLLSKDLSISVAGRGADWLINKYDNVKYCGFVPDVQDFMSQAKVIAIPSISGGGIQIKTLDAIASGILVVATPFALRGISEYPSSVTVAETSENFATCLEESISQPINPKLFMDALKWSQDRHENFFSEVAESINKNIMFHAPN